MRYLVKLWTLEIWIGFGHMENTPLLPQPCHLSIGMDNGNLEDWTIVGSLDTGKDGQMSLCGPVGSDHCVRGFPHIPGANQSWTQDFQILDKFV